MIQAMKIWREGTITIVMGPIQAKRAPKNKWGASIFHIVWTRRTAPSSIQLKTANTSLLARTVKSAYICIQKLTANLASIAPVKIAHISTRKAELLVNNSMVQLLEGITYNKCKWCKWCFSWPRLPPSNPATRGGRPRTTRRSKKWCMHNKIKVTKTIQVVLWSQIKQTRHLQTRVQAPRPPPTPNQQPPTSPTDEQDDYLLDPIDHIIFDNEKCIIFGVTYDELFNL